MYLPTFLRRFAKSLLTLLFLPFFVFGQIDYKKLSIELCQIEFWDKPAYSVHAEEIFSRHDIYASFTFDHFRNDWNKFTFLLQQEIYRNCPDVTKDGYKLWYPTIVDTDSSFQRSELTILDEELVSLKKNHDFELIVVTVRDYFPFENKDDFSFTLLFDNLNKSFKHHAILVLNKTSRVVRISTTEATSSILTDQICEELIQDELIAAFKNGAYFNGVQKAIERIKKLKQ